MYIDPNTDQSKANVMRNFHRELLLWGENDYSAQTHRTENNYNRVKRQTGNKTSTKREFHPYVAILNASI